MAEALVPVRGRVEDAAHGGEDRRRPSRHIRHVRRIAAAASTQASELLMAVNAVVPWDFAVAYLLRREREHLAEDLPAWLDVWYRLEALSALAAMADCREGSCTFPEIAKPECRPVFEGEGLGHPLLPEEEKVRNSAFL